MAAMAVNVNVQWREGTALFELIGTLEPQLFELLEGALAVAKTDAKAIVVDMSSADLSDRTLWAFRSALERAGIDALVLATGSHADRAPLEAIVGKRARFVDRIEDAGPDGLAAGPVDGDLVP